MKHQYLILKPIPPFRLEFTVWGLRRRRQNIIDQWKNRLYKRVLVIGNRRIGISIHQSGSTLKPSLQIKLSKKVSDIAQKAFVKQFVAKLLGTQVSLEQFYMFSNQDRALGSIVLKYVGFKPPRFISVFEAAVNGICCQQLSLTAGIILLNRLAMLCSEPVENDGELMYAFPEPEEIAKLKMRQLKQLGFSTNKAKTLLELAKKVAGGDVNLESFDALDDEKVISEICELRGLGRWTAEYMLLRGLGRLQIYPGDDIGFQNGLKHWLQFKCKMDYSVVKKIMKRWQPYGGMIYFHMLLERLSREKLISNAFENS